MRIAADGVYREMSASAVEVLYDDRDERAGLKFNDGDLLGMPLRVTVSRRTLTAAEGASVEIKARAAGCGMDGTTSAVIGSNRW